MHPLSRDVGIYKKKLKLEQFINLISTEKVKVSLLIQLLIVKKSKLKKKV